MWLERNTWRLTIATAANFLAVAAIDKLIFTVPMAEGRAIDPPDAHLAGISLQDAQGWFGAMAHDPLPFILAHSLTLDLTLPALLFLTIIALILRYGRRLQRFGAIPYIWQAATAIMFPLPYLLFDYAENTIVASLLLSGQQPPEEQIALLASLTAAKFSFLAIALLLCLCTCLAARLRAGRQIGD